VGHRISHVTVGELLEEMRYTPRSPGNIPMDRDQQFIHINAKARAHLQAGKPVIHVEARGQVSDGQGGSYPEMEGGITDARAAFAVQSICCWWVGMGFRDGTGSGTAWQVTCARTRAVFPWWRSRWPSPWWLFLQTATK